MRYKSMPLTTRTPSPTSQAGPQPGRAPHPWWVDWLLTLPILLLIPVILIPFLVKGAGPTLSIQGPAIAGQQMVIAGSGFPKGNKIQLLWDGDAASSWLSRPKVKGDGAFTLTAVLPATTTGGPHLLSASLERGNPKDTAARGQILATMTVQVTAIVETPTPSPEPTARSTPRATPTATPRPSATPVSTPRPTPTPEPSRDPAPPSGGPAVGYGGRTVGGAGGRTVAVTNLADSGAGSLRAALEASGHRIVVFQVAGTIRLRSTITVTDPYLTVAGETAPGQGITVRDGSLMVRASEVILRNLRLRPGDQLDNPSDADALTINGASGSVANVVVDHVTMLWGPDIGGLAILGDVRNVTVQDSIMGEGLYLSAHAEGTAADDGHSHAANVSQLEPNLPAPRLLTFWRNLFTTSNTRMPRFQGAECVDVVNNVIYNWGKDAAHGNPRTLNLVNNWYRSGPLTEGQLFWNVQTSDVTPNAFGSSVYLSGNVADGIRGGRDDLSSVYAGSPRCGGLSVAAGNAGDAYAAVLAGAGAISPVRDEVDRRVIANVVNRGGKYFNGAGYPSPNPYWP